MLETGSPASYPYVLPEDALNALEYAAHYRVESWDEYLVKLAKSVGNGIVYALDEGLKRVEGVVAVNPFPQELVKQYHERMKSKLRGSR